MIPDWLPPKVLAQSVPRKTKLRRAAYLEILSCLFLWLSCAAQAAFIYVTRGIVSPTLVLYAALFGTLWFFLLYRLYREKALVASGQMTQALLVGEQEAFNLFGKSYLNLTYDFYDESGLRVSGRTATRSSSEVHPKRLTVLYDPKKSSRNILYPPRYVVAID
ncbi:MAG: hypothetical protein PHW76_00555 [Alphaproteobacteria bacterium]|nr:hypothetical protein [Alphaproteobacteria bacterium]